MNPTRLLLAASLVVSAATPAVAADATKPHPHQGVVAAHRGKPEVPKLTNDDLKQLAAGKPVRKQIKKGDAGGVGLAVQDVHAPVDVVWQRILDYPAYPRMVDGVIETEVYEQSGDHIKVRMIINATVMRVEYFIDHTVKTGDGYVTWTLDYDRESDLDDSVGMWVVEPVPGKPGWTRVFYSVNVKLRGWVPSFVEGMIADSGLTQATAWVKRESEAAAGR